MVTKKTSAKDPSRNTAGTNAPWDGRDVNALVQYVIRESYLQTAEDLNYYAEKVKHYNAQKKALREYLQALRCVKTKFLAAARERGLDTVCPSPAQARELGQLLQQQAHAFKVGPAALEVGLPARVPAANIGSLDEFADEMAKWEEKLNTIGDDAQLANVDLQNILQKQQQVMQMLSNISKMTHDTAMSIIRKIGG